MGLGRTLSKLAIASSLLLDAPLAAAPQARSIAVSAGPLSSSLHELARRADVEIIFDEEMVQGISAPALSGRMSAPRALRRLLSGTNLSARRLRSGAFLIERRTLSLAKDWQERASDPQQEPGVPEILVVGRRTQNAEIRRRENDVQPYQVSKRAEVIQAHRDTLDEYLRSRVTANTQVLPPSLLDEGETLSEVDLRGLGSDGTLVLVDGRRLPSIPGWTRFQPLLEDVAFGFRQPDLNAIPLHAIERIETLTGTAGGIHGFGALGGVVNVVLDRNYRGAALHGTAGISSRGDARRFSLGGRVGFSPNGGRTDVMLYLSHSASDPLLVGQRHYAERDLEQSFRFAPERTATLLLFPLADSIFASPLISESLSLKPEYGGGTLGAGYTFLPVGFAGSPAEMGQAFKQRAGQRDFSLSEGQASSGLGSTPTMSAAILNVRHRFSGGLEAFVDALVMRNKGTHVDRVGRGIILAFDDSPINPFNESVFLSFPLPEAMDRRRSRFTTSRYTAGLIADLPLRWRGTAEMTLGSVRAYRSREVRTSDDVFLGPPLGPDLNPLGNWEEFQRKVVINPVITTTEARTRNRYREQSLRLAGPLFDTPGGTVTLSLLAERRSERVPAFAAIERQETISGSTENRLGTGARGNMTTSFYGEVRAPLFGNEASFPLVRQLELQLAARHDRLKTKFDPNPLDAQSDESGRRTFRGTSFTAGARSFPWPWLMLRGSYATGSQPPPLDSLIAQEEIDDFALAFDAKRGNSPLGSEGTFLHKFRGNLDLQMAEAKTLSVGAVLNPEPRAWPRLSLDYSRIRKKRAATLLYSQFVLDHEDVWPERVARAPLTELDQALGYTGGVITMLDERAMNAGGAKVESFDVQLDWLVPFGGGKLRLYGGATLQVRNEELRLFEPALKQVGFRNAPLKWRANGGAEWTIGRTTIGTNVQHFSRYRIADAASGPLSSEPEAQGSPWVRSQAYVDLYASRNIAPRTARPFRRVMVDFGIVNLLDKAPPRETGYLYGFPGYSRYGDPRRRRFELVLSSEF